MRARYITDPSASIDPDDRGLAYGDGLFETMSVREGRTVRLGLHLDRLGEGAARLELTLPDFRELSGRIDAEAARLGQGALKLIVTRGSGPRGYLPPADAVPVVIMRSFAARKPDPATEISVATLELRLGENEKLAGIKHLNRLEQVLGRLELQRIGADEGLMLSRSGTVIGGTSRNVFVVFGAQIVTPDLRLAGIAGVLRRAILELCPALGIDLRIASLTRADLDTADEIFMTNAIVGIQSANSLDGRTLEGRHYAARLRLALGAGSGA